MIGERRTKAGHDSQAFACIVGALRGVVDDPVQVGSVIFAALHDAGLRVVEAPMSREEQQREEGMEHRGPWLEVTAFNDDYHWWACASCGERMQGDPIAKLGR